MGFEFHLKHRLPTTSWGKASYYIFASVWWEVEQQNLSHSFRCANTAKKKKGIHWLALKEEMKKAQTHCPHCPHPHYTHQYFVPPQSAAPVGKQGRLLISSGGSLKFEYRLLLSNTECLFFWAPNNPINMMNLSWSDLCNTANASEGKLRTTFQHWRIFIEQKVHCPSYSAYFSIFKSVTFYVYILDSFLVSMIWQINPSTAFLICPQFSGLRSLIAQYKPSYCRADARRGERDTLSSHCSYTESTVENYVRLQSEDEYEMWLLVREDWASKKGRPCVSLSFS